jgi:hypothetical protein
MSKKVFHIANILVFIVLLAFNFLVLWAFGIGEDKITFADWFLILSPFGFWGILYTIQLTRNNNIWRVIWFGIMILFLYFWETGYGALFIRMFSG